MRPSPSRLAQRPRALLAVLLTGSLLTGSLVAVATAGPATAGPATAGPAGPHGSGAAGRIVAPPAPAQVVADPRRGGTTVPAVDRSTWPRTPGTGRFPRAALTGQTTATFQVTYHGFTPGAQAAFQRAVDIWARNVSSAVPITVDATFKPLPQGVLGSAGPTSAYEENPDGRYDESDTVYPIALANARHGRDLEPAKPDISAEFSSTNPNLYTGADPVPADRYDFTAVVLHELAHGLGFIGLADDVNGVGTYDQGNAQPVPAIYDRFPVRVDATGAARAILDYPRDSREFGDALTSGALFWDGGLGIAGNGGTRPKLYAPPTFESSSSYSHLDEDAFPTGSPNSLMTPKIKLGEVIRDPGPVVLGMFADMGWSVPFAPGSRYTPLDPQRLLDTRDGTGAPRGRVGAGGTVDLRVAGAGTTVPPGATAVVLNVTAVGASTSTDVRVYPRPRSGEGVPDVSTLNLAAGQTRANLVTVPVGADGSVRLRNEAGTVALLADLAGYYAPAGSSAFHPQPPVRLVDTRGTATPTLGPGGTLDIQVAGNAGVPANASAVVLTVTGARATRPSELRVYPTGGGDVPTVSNVNLVPGPPVPNLVIVKVGQDGSVRVRNGDGDVAVLVDLAGWYDPSSAGGVTFRPVPPTRILDTRRGLGTSGPIRLGPEGSVDLTVLDIAGVPSVATAVALNVTGVGATASTDVRVYPASGQDVPVVSNLNLARGQTAADAVLAPVGPTGQVRLRNGAGSLAVLADVSGWFGP